MLQFRLTAPLVCALALGGMAWGQARPVTVGIVLDGPSGQNAALLDTFKEQMPGTVPGAFELRFPPEKTVTADGAPFGVAAALDALLADTGVEAVLALGPLASSEAARRSALSKSVLAPFVPDVGLQGFPRRGDASGFANLSYSTNPPRLTRDLQTLRELCPFDRVAILADSQVFGDPVRVLAYVATAASAAGVQAQLTFVDTSANAALAALPVDAQAVYLGPMPRMTPAEIEKLIAGLNLRKLPAFSMRGREDVSRGALAGLASELDLKALAYRTAQNLQRILGGERAEVLPVLLPAEENLTLNMATARLLGLTPGPELLVEAELLNEEADKPPVLSLAEAVEAALSASPEIKVAQRQVEEAAEDVRDAKSGLLPQAEIGIKPAPRDPERALLGLPRNNEVAGAAGISQVVFSEKTRADVDVRRKYLERQEYDRQQIALDTAFETATAYLDVLKAEDFLRLQKRELRLVRSYLELARLRQERGVAEVEEVYRWESTQSTARKDTLDTEEQVRVAKVALNRVLHRPQEEGIEVTGSGLGDTVLLGEYQRILPYLEVPASFDALSTFLVQEGAKGAPELLRVDAELAARERAALAARREFYSPTITVKGEVSQVLGGEKERTEEDNSFKLPISLVPEREEADWGVGVHATLPLFSGGARRAARGKVNAELERLRLDRRDAKEELEQQIRSALLKVRASHAGVPQARQATASAGKGLEEVALAYERGAAGLAALLDAQNAAYVAEEAEINAGYEFLIDLLRVRRTSGHFDFAMSEQERENWFNRLDTFVHANDGNSPGASTSGIR